MTRLIDARIRTGLGEVRIAPTANPSYSARVPELDAATLGEDNRLTPTQAQTAVAAAILRQLYAVVVHQLAWDPVIAAHGTTGWKDNPNATAA